MIIKNNFSVLNNIDIKNFWSGILDIERRDAQLHQTQERAFVHTTAESFNLLTKSLKPSSSSASSSTIIISSNALATLEQFLLKCTNEDIGRKIMVFTKEITISSCKSIYFKTIGLNGVLDLSDSSENP